MTITPTALPEVLLIQPKKFEDKRGWFMESFRKDLLEKAVGHALHFCQDNQAQSTYGVIRGLHYQMPPHAQSKLVYRPSRRGSRRSGGYSKRFSKFWQAFSHRIEQQKSKTTFIPRGFAHGYSCLSENALLSYKVDNYYNKDSEESIAFNDPKLAIDWQIPQELQKLSPKDLQHPTFEAAQHFDNNSPCYD